MAQPEDEAAQRTVFEPSSEDDDSNHRDTALQSVGAAMARESASTIMEKMDIHTVDGIPTII